MISIRHNPGDHYWIVGGTGPHLAKVGDRFSAHTEVFSSKADTYVPADDPAYLKWRAAGWASLGFDLTTRIDTEANLAEVLKNAGVACTIRKGV